MKLIVISNPTSSSVDLEVETLNSLFRSGTKWEWCWYQSIRWWWCLLEIAAWRLWIKLWRQSYSMSKMGSTLDLIFKMDYCQCSRAYLSAEPGNLSKVDDMWFAPLCLLITPVYWSPWGWLCIALGLEYFHLRKPTWSPQQMEKYIDLVKPDYRNRIMVHSCGELVRTKGLKVCLVVIWFEKQTSYHEVIP